MKRVCENKAWRRRTQAPYILRQLGGDSVIKSLAQHLNARLAGPGATDVESGLPQPTVEMTAGGRK
jgi:hypothetical protein